MGNGSVMTGQQGIGTIRAVLTGKAVPYTRPGSRSAIAKSVRTAPVRLGPDGLEGDEQGDVRIHGGADKAVHCYAWAHYRAWRRELPHCGLLARPGAFGENLSVEGLVEEDVCLGDRWRVGSALLELSQGRQPCWKLNDRFDAPDMARRVQDSLRTGWYMRVIAPGLIEQGDAIALLERPFPDWTVARLLALIRDRVRDPAQLSEVLGLPLPDSWRRLFRARLESGAVESWARRLDGAR